MKYNGKGCIKLKGISKALQEYEYSIYVISNPYYIEKKYKQFNISIYATTADKYPYIKVTNDSYINYTKSCRISLIEPKYIKANDDPYDNWVFTEQEKIDFINMLKDNVYNVLSNIGDSFKDLSMWQYILQCYNFQIGDNKFIKTTPMPNYYLL